MYNFIRAALLLYLIIIPKGGVVGGTSRNTKTLPRVGLIKASPSLVSPLLKLVPLAMTD